MNLFISNSSSDNISAKNSFTLEEILEELLSVSIYALDIETTSLDSSGRITIISIATRNKSWAIEIRLFSLSQIIEIFKPVFSDPNKTVIFHNATFDVPYLNRHGVWFKNKIADTMILAWLFREDGQYTKLVDATGKVISSGHGLKHLVRRYLGHQMESYETARSLFGDFEQYATDDAKYTLELFFWLLTQLSKKEINWFWEVEMPITQIIIEMETRGVRLNPCQLKTLKKKALDRLDVLSKRITKLVGYEFDVFSAEQCGKALFDKLKIGDLGNGINRFSERGKSKGKDSIGAWSTSDDVLTTIVQCDGLDRKSRLIARIMLKVREIGTRLNTFIKPLLDRARENVIIHPSFIQIGTKTGRFASRNPNFQNLPKAGGVRTAFITRDGYVFIRSDFSQAELRLIAHFSQDPTMLHIYRTNGDIHGSTARACGVSRQEAKKINFGLCYRMSAKRLQGQLALEGIFITLEQAQDYVKKYFASYSGVRRFHKQVEIAAFNRLKQNGEFGYITTLGGRTRRLDKEYLTRQETSYTAVTQLINTTIQGGVSDLVKYAMFQIQNEFKNRGWLNPERDVWDAYLINQVHDEIIVEAKEEIAEEARIIISKNMENAGIEFGITVPMLAEANIVHNLGEK